MDPGFAIILVAALVLNVVLSIMQHRIYMGNAKRLQEQYAGRSDHFLVSGRGKGFLRGALVLLVIDGSRNQIVAARAMVGSTILVRFKDRPELLGPATSAPSRASDGYMLKAIEYAMEQYRVTRRAASKGKQATS